MKQPTLDIKIICDNIWPNTRKPEYWVIVEEEDIRDEPAAFGVGRTKRGALYAAMQKAYLVAGTLRQMYEEEK